MRNCIATVANLSLLNLKIFENNDPDQGWNGEYNNAGKQVMGGVYVFTVQYTGPRGNEFELKGNVTLIR